ncbi:MAG TPA: hypothetical protein VHP37_26545 [Burkholderiales bacterium]|nr:hypothetical protein [Burkholderiales bacterium]
MGWLDSLRDRAGLHRYYRRDPAHAVRVEHPPAALDLATVCFNNALVVRYQAKLLGKHLTDRHAYTVFDNSPPGRERDEIRAVCRGEGVSYVELPDTPFAGIPSCHHGAALNWICRRHFAPRALPYVGFIDHDLFPCRTTSLLDRIGADGLLGRIEERGERWYLWPGFCFLSAAKVNVAKLDFLPIPGLDTGGGNWPRLYRRLDRARLPRVDNRLGNVRPGDDKQADMVEWIGEDWLHAINASAWRPSNGKMALVEELLRALI